MDIRVSGHQISANVTFGKGPHDHGFRCAIVVHVMQGVMLKGEADSQSDAHAAFEEAAGHVEKQLRRHMNRLKDHHKHANGDVPAAMPEPTGSYTVFSSEEDAEDVPDNPPIIAEMSVDIPDASVSNAVWMLDLRNTNALLFKNSDTGVYNMVYRRRDGSIGWVEPERPA
jgi:ribosome-associated translation inhibitor RaiA